MTGRSDPAREEIEALAGRLSLRPSPDDLAAAVDALLAYAQAAARVAALTEAITAARDNASPAEVWVSIPHEQWRGLLAALAASGDGPQEGEQTR